MSREKKWKTAILFALVVELATTVVPFRASLWSQELFGQLREAQGRMDAISRVRYLLTEAEAGQRGYIISGDEKMLEPYRAAMNELRPARDALASRLNPITHQRLAALIDLKLDELSAAVAVRRLEGLEAAQAVLQKSYSRQYMDEFRVLSGQLVGQAEQEQALLRNEFARRTRTVAWISAIMTVVEVAVLGWILLLVFRLLNERARSEQALRGLAWRDALTGLYNRRKLDEALPQLLESARERGAALSLILLDLDHFKDINDRYGHGVGDDVLRAVARMLMSEVRDHDMVCRLGGEEMVVVMPDCAHEAALLRAQALCQRVRTLRLRDSSLQSAITASFGVASFPAHASDAGSLLHQADRAMYRAKQAGRDRVTGN